MRVGIRRIARVVAGTSALTALAVTAALVLAGFSAAPPASPVPPDLRAAIRADIFDGRWEYSTRNFTGEQRPRIADSRTVLDEDWSRVVAGCLDGRGFNVELSGGGFTYLGSTELAPADYAIAHYSCSVSTVPFSTIQAKLGPDQLDALYAYWTGVVSPCLNVAGQAVPSAPGRDAFRSSASARWDPFEGVRNRVSTADVAYFEARCPPLPTWLNLGSEGEL